MRFLDKIRLSRFLEFALAFAMILAAVLMVTLPWSIPDVTGRVPGEPQRLYEKYFAVLIFSGFMAELVLWQARGVMSNINRGIVFSENTVRRLNIIGWECLVIALFYFIMVFFVNKFFMVVVFVAFTIIGLILFVLAQLFRDAVNYKTENDMTI